ncbi:MauE/DoxX family redox-associated membrane protein [Hymenobacter caeli]|uniref:Thiosulfate dehydrogenase [quinone] large subunit n=1 Tax=Hymenobacter caeli TaxID=2735894 RepID=A0ABX2FST1_9BACT|nr:DoxX family protein [Hymenobacter caeli]NRT20017.1 thiosulfate dehydrogenase [quinone] large subunit [Hymenobacter caeli]
MNFTNPEWAFVMGRLLLGVSFLAHLLVRAPKLAAFQAGLLKQFAGTLLPAALVGPYALALPWAEGAVGLLLVLGWCTRPALVATMLLLTSLLFGSSLLEQWNTVAIQLLYGLYTVVLLLQVQFNRLCLDRIGRYR